MAAPAKAFIDPAGLSRTMDSLPINIDTFQALLVPTSKAISITIWNPSPWSMNSVLFGMMNSITTQNAPTIPTPPMGRQIIITFPSIYRERSGPTRPLEGQVWPRYSRQVL